jgi:hypothetical protein
MSVFFQCSAARVARPIGPGDLILCDMSEYLMKIQLERSTGWKHSSARQSSPDLQIYL